MRPVRSPLTRLWPSRDGSYTVSYSAQMSGNLQVFIGMRGRELPDCPFDVISDYKLRRKEALQIKAQKDALKMKKKGKAKVSDRNAPSAAGPDVTVLTLCVAACLFGGVFLGCRWRSCQRTIREAHQRRKQTRALPPTSQRGATESNWKMCD